MSEDNPLYASDMLIELGVDQCECCGALEGETRLRWRPFDAGDAHLICEECEYRMENS